MLHAQLEKNSKYKSLLDVAVLDVHAFERLLGPCMGIMQRNIKDYEEQESRSSMFLV